MKETLSSICLACFALFLLLAVARASSADEALYLSWTWYALGAAFFGLSTVMLRRGVRLDEERERQKEKQDRELAEFLSDKSHGYSMKIRSAETTDTPGRYFCDVEIIPDAGDGSRDGDANRPEG